MSQAILTCPEHVETAAAAPAALSDPARLAALFNDALALDAALTPQGWRYLWAHYGLEGLIALARRADWPETAGDEEVADALVQESLAGGYDPVSGRCGRLDERTQVFQPEGV